MTLFHNYECSNGDGTGIAGNTKIVAVLIATIDCYQAF